METHIHKRRFSRFSRRRLRTRTSVYHIQTHAKFFVVIDAIIVIIITGIINSSVDATIVPEIPNKVTFNTRRMPVTLS